MNIQSALKRSILLLTLFSPMGSRAQEMAIKKNLHKTENIMSTIQKNKEIVTTIFQEALSKKNLDLFSQLISEKYEGPGGKKGAAAFQVPIKEVIEAFPDAQWKIQEVIGEDNKVFIRWDWEGTQLNQFQEIRATGKKVASKGIAVIELEDGKVIKSNIMTDRFAFYQGLGVIPENLNALIKQADEEAVYFVDKFFISEEAKEEFYQRMNFNRKFIKNLPGFIEDEVYEKVDENGNIKLITIAKWANRQALNEAKSVVQAEYKKQGFNPQEMMKRLGVTMERDEFKLVNIP
jgi:steroid delta-isomerase-like uncharacterized protein